MDPNYNVADHSYRWFIGNIVPGGSGSVTLTVTVNEFAEPSGTLHNVAELWSSGNFLLDAAEDTAVCCWDEPSVLLCRC